MFICHIRIRATQIYPWTSIGRKGKKVAVVTVDEVAGHTKSEVLHRALHPKSHGNGKNIPGRWTMLYRQRMTYVCMARFVTESFNTRRQFTCQ